MIAIVLLLSLLATSPAVAQTIGMNRPSGSTIVTDWPFDSLSGFGWVNNGGGSVVTDSSDPASPPNVLQFFFQNGMPDGQGPGRVDFIYTGGNRDQYFAYWWKADSPFQNHNVATKHIYITDNFGNGRPFFTSMVGGSPPYSYRIDVQGGNEVDNQHLGAPFPGTWFWQSAPVLQLNRWHLIEGRTIQSSTTSSRDGAVTIWVDGAPIINVTSLNTARTGVTSGVIFDPVYGGFNGSVKSQNDFFWIGHAMVASGGSGPPPPIDNPPGPPGTVTGVTVTVQ